MSDVPPPPGAQPPPPGQPYGSPGYGPPGYGQPVAGPPGAGLPGQPGYQPAYPAGGGRKTNTLAIASLVLAVLCGGLSAPIAIPLGVVALGQIKRSNGTEDGRGLAIAGIAVSAVFFVIAAAAILVTVVFADDVSDDVNDQIDDVCEDFDADGDGINDCEDFDFDTTTTFTIPG